LNAGERAPEGFADRIRRETQEALKDVTSRIAALRSDAEQVVQVAQAIDEVIPPEIAAFIKGEWVLPDKVATQPKPPTQPPVEEPRQAEPEAKRPSAIVVPPQATTATTALTTAPTTTTISSALQKYPAWNSGAPMAVRRATALAQKAVHESVTEKPGTVGELSKRLGIPTNRVGDYVRDLAQAGLLRLTGEQRKSSAVYAAGDGTPVALSAEMLTMPAAKSAAPFAVKYVNAYEQLLVAQEVAAVGRPVVIAELEKRRALKGIPRNRITDALNQLSAQGTFVVRTGKFRHAKGQTAGRTAVEYKAVAGVPPASEGGSPPTPARPHDADRADTAAGSSSSVELPTPEQNRADVKELGRPAAQVLAKVRDYMASQPKEGELVMPSKVAHAIELPVEITLACLEKLANQGIINDVGVPGAPAFSYTKPKDEGAAARLDRERGRQRAAEERRAPNGGVKRGMEIPGTGRGLRTGNPRSQEIVDAVLAQGGSARFDGNDHVMIMLNNQQRRIGRTPGGSGTSARGKAREIGVRV
jgi:hypothetical protein